MLSVVVHTNIYVSALIFDGTPALALQLATAGVFQLIVSETIQAEVEETLTRKFGWDAEHFAAIATELWRRARHVTPAQPVKASRDPDDDHILACALEAHAQVILTGDGDLLSLHPYRSPYSRRSSSSKPDRGSADPQELASTRCPRALLGRFGTPPKPPLRWPKLQKVLTVWQPVLLRKLGRLSGKIARM